MWLLTPQAQTREKKAKQAEAIVSKSWELVAAFCEQQQQQHMIMDGRRH